MSHERKYDSEFCYHKITVNSFRTIDTFVDNFKLISDVESILMYGDEDTILQPWISVIIPTYERKELFFAALDSALNQEETDFLWEIIVVDNTSLDKNNLTPALKYIRELASERVLYYRNASNIGPGFSWNRGVELARGEWVCFLHDDDVLCVDALKQIGALLRKGRCANDNLGYLNARRVDFKGEFGTHCSTDFRHYPQELLTRFGVLVCGHTGAGAPTCGTTILKKAYMEVGGINYDFGPSADAVLCYQIMKQYAVVTTDCVIGGYRWAENGTLNPQSLLNLIRADDLLMSYVYQKSRWSALWGRLFGDTISWRNVWRKNNTAKENQVEITREEFAASSAYSEPPEWKKNIYLVVYAMYRLMRWITGYLRRPKMRRSQRLSDLAL